VAGDALLIVDVQNDFCPGGALPVPDGDRVVAPLNRCAERFARQGAPIYASRDWHPAVTTHFTPYGGVWPPHCVADSEGARFHPGLRLPPSTIVVTKGDDAERDGYSAFDGRTADRADLLDDLRRREIDHLYVGGLATDYCVRQSVLDALNAGVHVSVLTDAIRAVEVRAGDGQRAVEEMARAGATFVTTIEVIDSCSPVPRAVPSSGSSPSRWSAARRGTQ
jgi:nicotinamidase/pyrazinamidase